MDKIIELLKQYETARQNLFEYTDAFYDSIGYDIDGYWEDLEELTDKDVKDLQKKIKNFEALTKCYAKIAKADFKYC
jgi:hypothetical protein